MAEISLDDYRVISILRILWQRAQKEDQGRDLPLLRLPRQTRLVDKTNWLAPLVSMERLIKLLI